MKAISPVIPGALEAAEKVIGESQEEYTAIPAIRFDGEQGHVITRWEFSDDDRAAIAAGASLLLSTLTFGSLWHPVLLTVGNVTPAPRGKPISEETAAAVALHGIKVLPVQCCELDDDKDGNCQIHSAPGVLREKK